MVKDLFPKMEGREFKSFHLQTLTPKHLDTWTLRCLNTLLVYLTYEVFLAFKLGCLW